jgi:hypothetical protein
MSIGLKEKKKNNEPADKKEGKSSSPEAIRRPLSSVSSTEEPDVFDSYRDNAMSQMKQTADMEPDNATKVFSHVEEKQRLEPTKISVNDDNEKKIDFEKSLKTNLGSNGSSSMANPTVEGIDSSKSLQCKVTLKNDIKPETTNVQKASGLEDSYDSVRFYDSHNQGFYANPLNYDDNPIIQMIKMWQDITTGWINLWNEPMKYGILFKRK